MISFRHHPLRHDAPHLFLVFLILIAVYVWSMPRTVVLEDDGFFILAAYFNSVTHPPGYPLFVMFSHLFTWLPVGSVAFRVHLASACFGALACVCFWYLARCLFEKRIFAYAAALGLGLSRAFWSQAIISEVYTLNVLLFLLLFILVLHCVDAEKKRQSFYCKWLAFIYGLALSNHWPLILLSTPALLVLIWPVRKCLFKNILNLAPFFILGLLPYVWLAWRSHVVPEYSFYGPIQSWQEFWYYVSRQSYADADHSLTAGWWDKWMFILFVIRETAAQIGLFGFVFAVAGFIQHWLTWPGRLALSMTFAFLGSTIILILMRGVDYELFQQAIFQVYPLISYAMVVLWAIFGIRFIVEWIARKKSQARQEVIANSFVVLVIASTFIVNAPQNFRKNDYLAVDYARIVLESLEPDAVFYANADNIDGPVRYLNVIEGVRPDVTIYTGRYLNINDRLYRPYQLEAGELKNLINDFIRNTERPVYYVNDFLNDYARDRYGFYAKVNKSRPREDKDVLIIDPAFLSLFKYWSENYTFVNTWDKMHYNLVLAGFCELTLNAKYSDKKISSVSMDNISGFVCANFQGTLIRLMFALEEISEKTDDIDYLFVLAESYKEQAYTKEERARMEYYRGMFNLYQNNNEIARLNFQTSFRIWPHPDNPSQGMLSSL